jgi:hypothetical protein
MYSPCLKPLKNQEKMYVLWYNIVSECAYILSPMNEESMKVTEQELAKRNLALENAIASQRLEGLEPDGQTIADLKCVVRGEFGMQESLRRVKERVALGHFREG